MEKRVDELILSSSNYLGYIRDDVSPGTPSFKCAVFTCKNKFVCFETHKNSTFKFHNFPKNPNIHQTWRALCKLPLGATIKLKVCSDHFTLDDYERNLKEELLNSNYKRPLKPTALPSLNIGVLENKELVINEIETLINTDSETDSENKKTTLLLSEVNTLKKDIKCLDRKIKHRQKYILLKKNKLSNFKKSLEEIKTQIEKQKECTIPSFFSEAQVNLLKGRKKKVYWSDDDLAQAFTLRHKGGKDFYLYMKNTLNYPLPSLSCVQAWAGNN